MHTLAQSDSVQQRSRIFMALAARNRFVDVLRFAVPALGLAMFGGLVLQLFLASLGDDFSFSNLSIDRNNLVVDTPSYSGTGSDGSIYVVEAASAKSALGRTDIIDLTRAALTIKKPGGVAITVQADAARIETTSQLVTIDGPTRIADSEGMRGTIVGISANLATETMTGNGPVDITFSNGATLTASSMTYDGARLTWGFARPTLTLLATPGEDEVTRASRVVGNAAGDVAGQLAAQPAAIQAPRPMARRPPGLENP